MSLEQGRHWQGAGKGGKRQREWRPTSPVASRAALLLFPDLLSQNTSKAAGLRNDNPRSSLARLSVGRWQINQLSAVITIKVLSIRKGKSGREKKCKESTQGPGGGSHREGSWGSRVRAETMNMRLVFPREVPAGWMAGERLHTVKTEGNPSLTLRE